MDRTEAVKLIDEWFDHPNWWFSSTPSDDARICQQFQDDAESMSHWPPTPKNHLARILMEDQIVRHRHRGKPEMHDALNPSAVRLASEAMRFGFDSQYTPAQRCFMLLPFRHSKNRDMIEFSIRRMEHYRAKYGNHPIYERFRMAGLRSLSKMINEEIVNGPPGQGGVASPDPAGSGDLTFPILLLLLLWMLLVLPWWLSPLMVAVLASRLIPMWVIPTFLFGSDFLRNRSLKVLTGDYSWGGTVGTACRAATVTRAAPPFRTVRKKVLSLQKDGKIGREALVSLSGGVDSMCVLNALLLMRNHGQLDRLAALHINYGNRFQSRWEERLVVEYCRYHGVELFVRRIGEIKRDRKRGRDDYEKLTQEIRFDLYRRLGMPVYLGHNRDDRMENVFTNIRRRSHYENLFGMETLSNGHGVTLVRPLLTHSKAEILRCARETGMVHTRNSTPGWCDRGRIRNILIPFLHAFDPGFEPGMELMADHMMELSRITEVTIREITGGIRHHPSGTTVAELRFRPEWGTVVWSRVITEVCNRRGLPVPSRSSIDNFAKNITSVKALSARIKLSERLWADKPSGDVVAIYSR